MKRNFTLIELLVVIAIISILAALLLPALQSAKQTAYKAVCLSNQKQCGLSLASYGEDFNSYIPAAANYHMDAGAGLQNAPWGLFLFRPPDSNGGPVGNEVQTLPAGYLVKREIFLCPVTESLKYLESLKPSDWNYRDMNASYGMYYMRRDVLAIGDDEWKAFAEKDHCPGETWMYTRIPNVPSPCSWALIADTSGGGNSLKSTGCGFFARRMSGDENAFWLAHGTSGNVLFGDFHAEGITQGQMGTLSNSKVGYMGNQGIRNGRSNKGAPIYAP